MPPAGGVAAAVLPDIALPDIAAANMAVTDTTTETARRNELGMVTAGGSALTISKMPGQKRAQCIKEDRR